MKILRVLTSHDQLGKTGRKSRFWLEESRPRTLSSGTLASNRGWLRQKDDSPRSIRIAICRRIKLPR
jgi:hypothetical protein